MYKSTRIDASEHLSHHFLEFCLYSCLSGKRRGVVLIEKIHRSMRRSRRSSNCHQSFGLSILYVYQSLMLHCEHVRKSELVPENAICVRPLPRMCAYGCLGMDHYQATLGARYPDDRSEIHRYLKACTD